LWTGARELKISWGKRGAESAETLDRDAEGVKEGEVWGGGIPVPIRLEGLGSVVSSPSGVWGGAPAKNEFGAF